MYQVNELWNCAHTQAKEYLQNFDYPWQALQGLKDFIYSLGEKLPKDEYDNVKEGVWIHKTAKIAPTAYIDAPCIIGEHSEIRQGAFIRGSALVGKRCVVGNSTELKNVILFDEVQVPHFNYIGDSILGYKAHLGAGAVTSNVKSNKTLVVVKEGQESIPTGLKKMGAMLGDYVEVGCNSVLNPGTVIGKNSQIYPLSCVRGVIKANTIYKTNGICVMKKENETNG